MVKHKFAKIFLLLILLITVIIIIYMIIELLSGSNNYEDLIFHNFNLQDEYFSVNVETWSSGKTFRKYKYKIEDRRGKLIFNYKKRIGNEKYRNRNFRSGN